MAGNPKRRGIVPESVAGAGVVSSADPLGLAAPAKVRKRAAAAREALVRKPGLEHLRKGRHPMPKRLFDAAFAIRFLWIAAQGDMQAAGWLRERVDGGGMMNGLPLHGALDADRSLRRIAAAVGREAGACMLAVCCEDITVTAYAREIETDPVAVGVGGCTTATLERVRSLLRGALEEAADILEGRRVQYVHNARGRMLAWMAAGARPIL